MASNGCLSWARKLAKALSIDPGRFPVSRATLSKMDCEGGTFLCNPIGNLSPRQAAVRNTEQNVPGCRLRSVFTLARPRLRPARSKGIMIGLGAALTGQSGLVTAGPRFVKVWSSPGRSRHSTLVLDSHVHLLFVRKAGAFA